MSNGHNRRIVWVTYIVPVSLLAVRVSAILYVVIISGPSQFTITSVSIEEDRNLIKVTYIEVSRATIYGYRPCMTL